MALVSKNLGFVKAIYVGTTAPSNIQMIWYNTGDGLHYAYSLNTTSWVALRTTTESFLDLNDVDVASYAGQAGKVVVVKATEDGLELDTASGGTTDLSVGTRTSTTMDVNSSTGADVTLPSSSSTEAGLMSSAAHVALSTVVTNAGNLVTLSGVATNATTYGTFTGSTLSDSLTAKALFQEIETSLELKLTGSGVANYLSKYSASLVQTSSLLYDSGTALSYNTTTGTYTFNLTGQSASSIGMVRHITAATAGNSLSIYAGGAVSGGTNLNGGNLDLYPGIPTGTGTSQFNVYTYGAGSTGTTDGTATLKLNIDGAGTAFFTTTTANSKLKHGHNLATILTQTTGMGIMLSRPSDGSYTVHGGMFASATSDMLTITGFGAGIRFVRNPSTDTAPMVTIGATDSSYICGGVTTATIPVHFAKVAGSGAGRLSYWGMTGNLTGLGGLIAHEYNNAVTNNTYNTCFLINVSGSSTSNRAVHAETGDIWVQAGQIAIGATAPAATSKLSIIGLAANSQTVAIRNELVTSGSNQLLTINSSNVTSATKFGTYYSVEGSSTSGGNKAIYIYSGNFILREAGGSMGLGTDTPDASCILDVVSITKGVGLPSMTTTEKNAIASPRKGTIVYDNTTDKFCGYNGAWVDLH